MGFAFGILFAIGGVIYIYYRAIKDKGGDVLVVVCFMALAIAAVALLANGPEMIYDWLYYDLDLPKFAEFVSIALVIIYAVGIGALIYWWYTSDVVPQNIVNDKSKEVYEMVPTEEELAEVRAGHPLGYIVPKTGFVLSCGVWENDIRAWRNLKVTRLSAEEMLKSGRVDGTYRDEMDVFVGMYKDMAEEVARQRAEIHNITPEIDYMLRDIWPVLASLAPTSEELAAFKEKKYGKEKSKGISDNAALYEYKKAHQYRMIAERLVAEGNTGKKYESYIHAIRLIDPLVDQVFRK